MKHIIHIDEETTITDREYLGLIGLAFVGSMTISGALVYGIWKLSEKGFEYLWDRWDQRMKKQYEKQKTES